MFPWINNTLLIVYTSQLLHILPNKNSSNDLTGILSNMC